jgi:hypothetical protein
MIIVKATMETMMMTIGIVSGGMDAMIELDLPKWNICDCSL